MSAVDVVRALLAKATPGPWTAHNPVFSGPFVEAPSDTIAVLYTESNDGWNDWSGTADDAELIAQAPTLLAALADEVEQLREWINMGEIGRLGKQAPKGVNAEVSLRDPYNPCEVCGEYPVERDWTTCLGCHDCSLSGCFR